METLTAFIPLIPLAYSIYGLIKKQRFFFLLGYCLFAFMIIISELLFYFERGDFFHLLTVGLFFIQLIISHPNTLIYFGESVFKSFAIKSALILIMTNIFGIFIVLNNSEISQNGVIFHAVFAFLPFIFYYLMLNNKISVFKSNKNVF